MTLLQLLYYAILIRSSTVAFVCGSSLKVDQKAVQVVGAPLGHPAVVLHAFILYSTVVSGEIITLELRTRGRTMITLAYTSRSGFLNEHCQSVLLYKRVLLFFSRSVVLRSMWDI